MPRIGDPRAWDAAISGVGWIVPVEGETRLGDSQALARRIELKRRDGGFDHVILLVADTRHNRRALRGATSLLADFPVGGSVILAALGEGRAPDGSGIVLL
jgi:hypothetical protein